MPPRSPAGPQSRCPRPPAWLDRDPAKLAALGNAIGDRPVIAAASTHPGEEAIVIEAHRRLRGNFPGLLTLIAPRHPERGAISVSRPGKFPRRRRCASITMASSPGWVDAAAITGRSPIALPKAASLAGSRSSQAGGLGQRDWG